MGRHRDKRARPGPVGGRRGDEGAAAVEFAIVLPLLLVLLFGIIEFGVLLFDKAMITNASREGARRAILFQDPRPTLGDVQSVVNAYCANHLITFAATPSPPTIATNPAMSTLTAASAGTNLTVTVTYPFRFLLIPAFVTSITCNVTLSGVTTMRVE